MDKYLKKHHPDQQENTFNGVIINPVLRADFNATPNDERDPLETEHWFGRPYIETSEWNGKSWEDHVALLETMPTIDGVKMTIPSKEDYEAEQEASLNSWLKTFPTGIRYNIRCLDGGAWDRSTNRGFAATLEQAIEEIGSL